MNFTCHKQELIYLFHLLCHYLHYFQMKEEEVKNLLACQGLFTCELLTLASEFSLAAYTQNGP